MMSDIQPDFDFDSAFALQYDSFIRLAIPMYDQLFPMAGSFLMRVANDAQRFFSAYHFGSLANIMILLVQIVCDLSLYRNASYHRCHDMLFPR
jgi:hypothetical protein